ncbi:MAG: hypothetical protein HYU86_08010 [Chloroflexi bacterium]|nr:hypothetical protein [Chloroflexota bacterium]
MAMSALKINDMRPLLTISIDGLADPAEGRRHVAIRTFAFSQTRSHDSD